MINKEILRKLKLIVFDLDGTLLDSSNQIGEETIHLVNELKGKGIKFSFASGRLHSAIVEHAEKLQLQVPIISLDGALIKNNANSKVIFESYIPERYVKKAIKLADRFLLKVALCHGDAIYYTEHNSLIPDLLDKFGAIYKEVDSYDNYLKNTLEIVVTGDYKESIKYLQSKMMFPYTFGVNTSYYKSHSRGDLYYFEARRQGCTKGTGLKRLAKHLKIKTSETAVMGDWYNDRALFETAGVKVAVANAVPEIKRIADLVTKRTNDEDATAEFIKMVLDSKK